MGKNGQRVQGKLITAPHKGSHTTKVSYNNSPNAKLKNSQQQYQNLNMLQNAGQYEVNDGEQSQKGALGNSNKRQQ